MKTPMEMIDLINHYEFDESGGESLRALGGEVVTCIQQLINAVDFDEDSQSFSQALSLMGRYTEVDWDDYPSADGFWIEHVRVVDILMRLGECAENPASIIPDSRFPFFYRFGATINPDLESDEIDSLLNSSLEIYQNLNACHYDFTTVMV